MRQRIRDSYEARWKAEKHFDEDQILNEMPGSLRIEVSALAACGMHHYRCSGAPSLLGVLMPVWFHAARGLAASLHV